jgi:hypothetical protein
MTSVDCNVNVLCTQVRKQVWCSVCNLKHILMLLHHRILRRRQMESCEAEGNKWRRFVCRIFSAILSTTTDIQSVRNLRLLALSRNPFVGTEKKVSADNILTYAEFSWRRKEVKCSSGRRSVYTTVALFSKVMRRRKCFSCVWVWNSVSQTQGRVFENIVLREVLDPQQDWANPNESKFYSVWNWEQTEARECLLSFGAEYCVFQFAIQKCKD